MSHRKVSNGVRIPRGRHFDCLTNLFFNLFQLSAPQWELSRHSAQFTTMFHWALTISHSIKCVLSWLLSFKRTALPATWWQSHHNVHWSSNHSKFSLIQLIIHYGFYHFRNYPQHGWQWPPVTTVAPTPLSTASVTAVMTTKQQQQLHLPLSWLRSNVSFVSPHFLSLYPLYEFS